MQIPLDELGMGHLAISRTGRVLESPNYASLIWSKVRLRIQEAESAWWAQVPLLASDSDNRSSGMFFGGEWEGRCQSYARDCRADPGRSPGEEIRVRFPLTSSHCSDLSSYFRRSSPEHLSEPSKWRALGQVNRTGAPLGGQHYETDVEGSAWKDLN